MPEYLTQAIDSPAAWKALPINTAANTLIHLNSQQIDELRQSADKLDSHNTSWTDCQLEDFELPSLQPVVESIRAVLEGGHGFVVVSGFPIDTSIALTKRIFFSFGHQLGFPDPQDAAGHLLHDIRDTGSDLLKVDDLRLYQTNRELDFHNDGSDAFLLLCIEAALAGGQSRLVSAVTVFNEILTRRPDLAHVLQEPFPFDARGQQVPGQPRVQTVPIYAYHEGYLNVLFKRTYIEMAERFPEVPPLTEPQKEAMDLMSTLCETLSIEFTLRPGELLIANNYDLLHGRPAYQDHPGTPDKRRHMLRLWLSLPNGRPLPPHFKNTREFCHSFTRRQDSNRSLS